MHNCRTIWILAFLALGFFLLVPAYPDSVLLIDGQSVRCQITRYADNALSVLVMSATGVMLPESLPMEKVVSFEVERDEILAEVPEISPNLMSGKVSLVVSGDTIVLEDGETVRYLGVTAPRLPPAVERPEVLAEQSKEFNMSLVNGKKVGLEFEEGVKRDKDGFLLAYVYADGKLINGEILKKGFGRVAKVPRPKTHDVLFLQIQERAREQGLGIWALPEKFRPVEQPDALPVVTPKGEVYISNKFSKKYHLPTCEWARSIGPETRIEYPSRDKAEAEGRQPCPFCLPEKKE